MLQAKVVIEPATPSYDTVHMSVSRPVAERLRALAAIISGDGFYGLYQELTRAGVKPAILSIKAVSISSEGEVRNLQLKDLRS